MAQVLATDISKSDFHPSALSDIYQDETSLAVWKRQLDTSVSSYANQLLAQPSCYQTRLIISPSGIAQQLEKELPLNKYRENFIDDIVLVSDMFSCLFDLKSVGLRLAVLNTAMCPKFHVDRVPARLISTYAGKGTQWHSHEQVERFDNGTLQPRPNTTPNSLNTGDVALLKGEAWIGNEGRGLVHRSPSASDCTRRLVLTLDFA